MAARSAAMFFTTFLLAGPLHATVAHAAIPDLPPLWQHWTACANPDDAYSIETATRDGVDMLAGDGATARRSRSTYICSTIIR